MVITDEEKSKLIEFFEAVDEMIEGRFILSDTKVSNILKSIVKSELLYNLYSKCMNGFNFLYILERSKASNSNNGGYFIMPDEERDIVAFTTCLLLEVDKKNINLQNFVTDNFFSTEGYNISYNNFALVVLVAYKTAIRNLLGIDENCNAIEVEDVFEDQISMEDMHEVSEEEDRMKILFANLLMNISELQNLINDEYKIKYDEKEELLIVLKALNKAIKMEDLLIINALLVPLEHMLTKHKKLRPIYENVKMLIADIYY